MPIRCYINPEFNLILFIGDGLVTGSDYFKAAEIASQDKLRKWGMVTIVDLLSAETDFELQDMRFAIEFTNNLSRKKLEPEQVIALTSSKAIHLISDSLKLLPSKVPVKLDLLNSVDELISFLGISERKQEFMAFYDQCKNGK
ncbi:MAG: hypothetical protein KA473_06360 [Anaerolineales bacterium]|nr:hypothetical protein [Anaerolineales bacterium]MBP6209045.1 hypothetical protein [Anaerolineales bacterium]